MNASRKLHDDDAMICYAMLCVSVVDYYLLVL